MAARTQQLDWHATETRARGMSLEALHYARLDCVKAAEAADALERAGVPVLKTGGYYRDESSVYANEQRLRQGLARFAREEWSLCDDLYPEVTR